MSSRISRWNLSSLAIAASRASSRRAICRRWTRSVVRVNRTRQPFSTRAKPRAAARWLLPPPGGPNNSKLAPLFNQASPAASAMTCALLTTGTASKSKVSRVLPGGSRASASGGWMRREASAECVEIGQSAGIEFGVDGLGELRLAGPLMSERQQPDHGAARLLLAVTGQQRFEGASIGSAREELLAIDQVEQGHW